MKNYIYIYLLLIRMKICERAKYDLIKWTMLTKMAFLWVGESYIATGLDIR